MRRFDGPFPDDFVFMKLAGSKGIHSAPLCELFIAINGVHYDPAQSTAERVILIENGKNGKQYECVRSEFVKRIQTDTFKNDYKIADMCIQPKDELQTPEVMQFIEKYLD